jgi:MoaA/NifB/PqqE/SkfB family radical SAM enzyme
MFTNQCRSVPLLELKGIHFLLTYMCNVECDHCFVWGSPKTRGVFTLSQIKNILMEATKLRTVGSISIEGGEPFLYYPIMVKATHAAINHDFNVEILSNCYWATCLEDAVEWLRPISEVKNISLSLSSDLYHGESWEAEEVKNAVKAAKERNMKVDIIAIKYPKSEASCPKEIEGVKVGVYNLMYKGRAASKLTQEANKTSWDEFTKCPYEDLVNPKRVHIDPFGYVHVCQGISINNAWRKPFSKIIEEYEPYENPIIEPLIRGGPTALVEKFDVSHDRYYTDACHLCYTTRCVLRNKFPDILGPDEMYGVF